VGLAWVEGEAAAPEPAAWPLLAERVRAAFDPEGRLV
jgi:hypothetical protein